MAARSFRFGPGLRLLLILAAGGLESLCPASAEGPQYAPTTDPAALIVQLGDDSFEVRERAMRALATLGLEARPVLETALASSDPEVRRRAQRALDTILRNDLKQRLSEFAADTNPENDHGFPGWKRFRDLVGNSQEARTRFVEMQQAESDLLVAAQGDPRAAAEEFHRRAYYLQQLLHSRVPQQISLGSVSALLFVGADNKIPLKDEAAMPIFTFLSQTAFQQSLNQEAQKALSLKLLGSWIENRTESAVAYQNLHLAMRYELKEGLAPALAIVQNRADASSLQSALLTIGKLGSRQHLPLVEQALENETVCASYRISNKTISTQVRDVALAVCLEIVGESHADYGFARLQKNAQSLFNVHTLGFEDDQSRDKSLEKWKAWRARHPHPAAASAAPATANP